jgi:hemerythrin-like domain-containing protein
MGGSFFHDVGGCSMRALMCEYCGCQQIATIAELTREHDAVVALVGQIKTSLPDRRRDDVAESCQQILAILAVHTVVEEEGLFPEMTGEFPDHISVLRSEHREIEKVLGEAADGFPDDPTWPDRLVAILHLLREHILKEQNGVFPAALVALDAEQWERIEAVRAQISLSRPWIVDRSRDDQLGRRAPRRGWENVT